MNSAFFRFLLIQVLLLAFIFFVLKFLLPELNIAVPNLSFYLLFWFPVLSIAIHLFLKSALKNENPNVFVRSYMIGMTLKMFLSVLILTLSVYLGEKSEAKLNISIFAGIYFCYFILDIINLKSMLKSVKN